MVQPLLVFNLLLCFPNFRFLDRVSTQWGDNKEQYYDTDYRDEEHSTSDEADALEEEAEVARLEARKAKHLSADDFGADGDDADARQARHSTGPQTDAELVERMNAELDEIDFDLDTAGADVGVERIDRDISRMSRSDKVAQLQTDAPELMQLLDDFRESIDELSARLAPVVESMRGGERPVSDGITFLDVKFHLLLNYCTNVAFYLLLKAEGRSVREHPVILQLVKTRTLLEKLRPLDKKLSYQIDKLLKLAQSLDTGDEAAMQEAADAVGTDPLRHRPRAALLMTDDGAAYDDDDANHNDYADGEEEEEEEEEDAGDGDDDGPSTTGRYVPPRLVAMPYEEEDGGKKKRVTEHQRRRAVHSEMAKFVMSEFGDEPEEEMAIHGGAYTEGRSNKVESERQDYEEENFVRLMLSKKEQRARDSGQLRDELKLLNDYTDLAALEALENDGADAPVRSGRSAGTSSLRDVMANIEAKNRKLAANFVASGDADAAYPAKAKRVLPRVVDDDDDDNDAEGDEQALEDNPIYSKALAQHAGKKRTAGEVESEFQSGLSIDADAKRSIGKRIEKNRGLVRPRNDKRKTPRTGLRNKHSDAIKRRKGAVPTMRATEGPYEGEKGGVKSTVVRSRQLTR
jgi:U3 small nucleolar RNA-associated protein 3